MCIDYKELYETNADFEKYVDRHCAEYGVTVEQALQHAIVKEVGKWYIEQQNN